MIGIPEHLGGGYQLALVRPKVGGVAGWRDESPEPQPYWVGEGYVSLGLSTRVAADDGATRKGFVLTMLEPPPAGGMWPKASDQVLVDGVLSEIVSVRPPDRLIGFWKLELRTGEQ